MPTSMLPFVEDWEVLNVARSCFYVVVRSWGRYDGITYPHLLITFVACG